MMEWLGPAVPYLKALHIVALIAWCGGLLGLPLMLAHHDPHSSQDEYARIRHATHFIYCFAVTPAAVTAVIAGTWLIFLRATFEPWFFAKLLFVAVLVMGHAWIGHILIMTGESLGRDAPPPAYATLAVLLISISAILFLVLGKPEFPVAFPEWLTEPRNRQLPFAIPKR